MDTCCSTTACATPAKKTHNGDGCPRCATPGRRVAVETVRALLHADAPVVIDEDASFSFCETSSCEVVYYDDREGLILEPQLTTRVGVKDGPAPHPVCYCFAVSKEDIASEARATGASKASARIGAAVRRGECACEVKNPAGRCCLGEVRAVERAAQDELRAFAARDANPEREQPT